MARLSPAILVLLPLLAACEGQDASFNDVEAIAASKVEVCHFNNGAHEYSLIDVAESSVESHIDHGDTLYADDQDCDGEPDYVCDAHTREDLDAWLAGLEAPADWDNWEIYAWQYEELYDLGGAPTANDASFCSGLFGGEGHYEYRDGGLAASWSRVDGESGGTAERGGTDFGYWLKDSDYVGSSGYSLQEQNSGMRLSDYYMRYVGDDIYRFDETLVETDPNRASGCGDLIADFAEDNGITLYIDSYTCGI